MSKNVWVKSRFLRLPMLNATPIQGQKKVLRVPFEKKKSLKKPFQNIIRSVLRRPCSKKNKHNYSITLFLSCKSHVLFSFSNATLVQRRLIPLLLFLFTPSNRYYVMRKNVTISRSCSACRM